MPSPSKEARVILALEALRNDKNSKLEAVARLYNVPASTLRRRRAGRPARRDTIPNSRRLTDSEEKALVQYIIELSERAFPPRLRGVEDMAENTSLRKANKAISKRRRAKRTRVQLGGSLAVEDAKDLLDQKAVVGEVAQEMQMDGGGAGGVCTRVRCCGVCGKPGHNARTCQEVVEASDSAVSDVIIVGL